MQNAPTHEPFMRNGENSFVWTRFWTFLVNYINSLANGGPTANRPNPAPYLYYQYFDTTLGKPTWAKTLTQYVDADGSNV